ncbi:putative DNA helicase Pif1 [Arabidopsis thaliana]
MSNDLDKDEAEEIKEFSNWLLAVGDGRVSEPNDGEVLIDIPEELLIKDANDPIEAITKAVYGDLDLLQPNNDPKFFQQKAILCPRNTDVNTINDIMLEKLNGKLSL